MVDTIKASDEVAEAFAAIDNQEVVGPQALLYELAGEAQPQDPPEPTSS